MTMARLIVTSHLPNGEHGKCKVLRDHAVTNAVARAAPKVRSGGAHY